MTHDEFTAALGAWEGYRIVARQRLEPDAGEGRKSPMVVIELEPDPGRQGTRCQPVLLLHRRIAQHQKIGLRFASKKRQIGYELCRSMSRAATWERKCS